MNSKDSVIVPKPSPAEILLLVPKTVANRKSVLAAADALARQAGASSSTVATPDELQKLLRLTPTNTSLIVMPRDFAELAATIAQVHKTREGEGRPTARFIVLSDKNFPPGKRPLHTRIFTLDRREDARAAIALAIEAAEEEIIASLRAEIARI